MGMEGGGLGDILGAPTRALGLEPSSIPLIGGMFNNPADTEHLAQMRASAAAYQQMRGPQAEASTQALQGLLQGVGGPGNQMMGDVYGPGAQMDFGMAAQNPVTPEMLAVGQHAGQQLSPEDDTPGWLKGVQMIDPAIGTLVGGAMELGGDIEGPKVASGPVGKAFGNIRLG